MPARVGVGKVLDTGAVTRHARRLRGACHCPAPCSGRGLRLGPGRGLGRARGPGAWLGLRMLAGKERTPTGAQRAPDAGLGAGAARRRLTGASMTPHPTGPRGPCSRWRGPTTWAAKASYGAGGGSFEHPGQCWGARCPSGRCGRKLAPELPDFTQAQHPSSRRTRVNNGLVTMLPAGELWRPRDARRPRRARGRRPFFGRAGAARVAA